MARIKSLQTLLDQADTFCKDTGLSKVASVEKSPVSALAELLSGAEAGLTMDYDPQTMKQVEIDKIAESLNRVQTASEIDTLLKLSDFEKKASEEGFTQEQIDEAISKLAAEKLAKSAPLLVAMGFVPFSEAGLGKNELPKKPVKETKEKSQAQLLGRLSLTKSMGY